MITYERLKHLLDYDPSTGIFTWCQRPETDFPSVNAWRGFHTRYAGKPAGCVTSRGYVKILLDKSPYYAHRLAWLFAIGEWPSQVIDHIDGDPRNNRLCNLRAVSPLENGRNQAMPRSNRSGVTGVHFATCANKWTAQIRVAGRVLHLGFFRRFEDAVEARAKAVRDHGFHANHGRTVASATLQHGALA